MVRLSLLSTLLVVGFQVSAATAPNKAEHGDAEAGKAKTAMCMACHGADGNSAMGTFPKLAGQNAKYLFKQMQDVKSGSRSIAMMTGMLSAFSDQDLQDIAAYYAAQEGTVGTAKPDLVEKGESIYRAGISAKSVAACTACHAPQGEGNSLAGFPKLSGQHADYIVAQLKAFRLGADQPEKGRTNDGESRMMRDVAAGMSDLDIESVASYIQGLR